MEQKQWALIRYEQVKRRGMGPETIKMQALIQRCDTELEEMELVKEYRADESNRNCESSQEKLLAQEPHPWLQKHYQRKRKRTIRLVQISVDQLLKEQQTVTIEAICSKSVEVDPKMGFCMYPGLPSKWFRRGLYNDSFRS